MRLLLAYAMSERPELAPAMSIYLENNRAASLLVTVIGATATATVPSYAAATVVIAVLAFSVAYTLGHREPQSTNLQRAERQAENRGQGLPQDDTGSQPKVADPKGGLVERNNHPRRVDPQSSNNAVVFSFVLSPLQRSAASDNIFRLPPGAQTLELRVPWSNANLLRGPIKVMLSAADAGQSHANVTAESISTSTGQITARFATRDIVAGTYFLQFETSSRADELPEFTIEILR